MENFCTPKEGEKKGTNFEHQGKEHQELSTYTTRRVGGAERLHNNDLSVLGWDRAGQKSDTVSDLLRSELLARCSRHVPWPYILVHWGCSSLQWEDAALHPGPRDVPSFQASGLQASCGVGKSSGIRRQAIQWSAASSGARSQK